jgi:hypothetical protein
MILCQLDFSTIVQLEGRCPKSNAYGPMPESVVWEFHLKVAGFP